MKSHKSRHDPGPDAEWRVTQCTCGHLTLQLGPIRIEFTPQEFAQLDRMVAAAAKRFDVESGDAALSNPKLLTH